MTFKMEATNIEKTNGLIDNISAALQYDNRAQALLIFMGFAVILFITAVNLNRYYTKRPEKDKQDNKRTASVTALFLSGLIMVMGSIFFIAFLPDIKSIASFESKPFTPSEVKPLTASGDPRDGFIVTLDDGTEKTIDFSMYQRIPTPFSPDSPEIKPNHTYKLTSPKMILVHKDTLTKDQKDLYDVQIKEVN